jgi:hypothetical protein
VVADRGLAPILCFRLASTVAFGRPGRTREPPGRLPWSGAAWTADPGYRPGAARVRCPAGKRQQAEAGAADPAGYYELKVDTNQDLVEDITWRFTFRSAPPASGTSSWPSSPGRGAADRNARRGPAAIPPRSILIVVLVIIVRQRPGHLPRSPSAGGHLRDL